MSMTYLEPFLSEKKSENKVPLNLLGLISFPEPVHPPVQYKN